MVILIHTLEGVGKRDADGQGQTFRDGYHNDDNTKDDILNKFLHKGITLHIIVCSNLDKQDNDQSSSDDNSWDNANESERDRQGLQLVFKLGLPLSVNLRSTSSAGAIISNSSNHSLAVAVNQIRIGEKEGVFIYALLYFWRPVMISFITYNIGLINDDAVSRNTITLTKKNDVTDH